MPRSNFARPWFSLFLGLSAAVTCVNGFDDRKAEGPKKDAVKETAKSAAKPAAPAPAHLVVAKDPVTGKLRQPTAEEAAELSRKQPTQTQTTPPKTVRGPSGSVGLVLDESSAVYSVATKGPDNKISTKEVTGKAAATKAVEAQSKKPETRQDYKHEK